MTANRAEYPIEIMARSRVSRSGFHAWQSREPSARDIADRGLTDPDLPDPYSLKGQLRCAAHPCRAGR